MPIGTNGGQAQAATPQQPHTQTLVQNKINKKQTHVKLWLQLAIMVHGRHAQVQQCAKLCMP